MCFSHKIYPKKNFIKKVWHSVAKNMFTTVNYTCSVSPLKPKTVIDFCGLL